MNQTYHRRSVFEFAASHFPTQKIFLLLLTGSIIITMALHGASGATEITSGAADSQTIIDVKLQDGLLTLQASKAPIVQVITAIGDAAGFETMVFGDLDHQLNRSFTAVPVKQALLQILNGVSNAMRFDESPEPKLTHVMLYGDSSFSEQHAEPTLETTTNDAISRTLDNKRASDVNMLRERASAGEFEAVIELADLLREDADPMVRGEAASVLGEIGDAAVVTILETGLRDNERLVRIRSIRGLASIKNDHSSQVLAEVMVNHHDMRTRLLAVWALGQQDTPLAQSYLSTALNDGDQLIRQAASRALTGKEDKIQK